MKFKVTVDNPCKTDTVTKSGSLASITYYLGDWDSISFSSYFTNTYSSCSKTYSMYSDAALTTAPDSSIFTMISSSDYFCIYSINTALHNSVYTIYVKN